MVLFDRINSGIFEKTIIFDRNIVLLCKKGHLHQPHRPGMGILEFYDSKIMNHKEKSPY